MAATFLPVLNEVEKQSLHERQPLPDAYLGLSDEEMEVRIAAARAALGDRLVILGHHYQRDEVDPLRRLHRRLVEARRARSPGIPPPTTSSSAACTSWPRAPTSSRCRISR